MNRIFLFLLIITFSCNNKPGIIEHPGWDFDIDSAKSLVWVADNADGTYNNPILCADYSDPDVVRVGDDYFMTASSFTCVPGLPILHSKDLVNWSLIGYALEKLVPDTFYNKPQQGKGVWAPCIRYHNDEFYIYYPDPDFGIYLVKAKNPQGPWSEPILVKEGKGLIDPSPLWDDDGNVYLVHAFAGSRAGIKSIIVVSKMNDEGTKSLDQGVLVFDGHEKHPTIEGPKFYKRNGYYYIFAPGGGVTYGWQVVLRSKNVYGPYEDKVVLAQGDTKINGPHQGAWVDTKMGEDWFIHFQDKGAFGRVVHLQPVKWINNWPIIGIDSNNDSIGEPVLTYKKPNVGATYKIITIIESDEFNKDKIGLQWQWNANPKPFWAFPMAHKSVLRLYAVPVPDTYTNFYYDVPNVLLQKFPSYNFTATTKLTFDSQLNGEKAGLLIMGRDYAYACIENVQGKLFLSTYVCMKADKRSKEHLVEKRELGRNSIKIRAEIDDQAMCIFSYCENGDDFEVIGGPFKAREGGWIGAKIGLFCIKYSKTGDSGNADFDWFRIE